jgi:CO/xanthine dehydrogenase Mo-binding subunit
MDYAVGSSAQRVDVLDKPLVTAVFTADVALPGVRHAQLLLSVYTHARLSALDTSAAAHLPGGWQCLCTGRGQGHLRCRVRAYYFTADHGRESPARATGKAIGAGEAG